MTPDEAQAAADRLRQALDIHAAGVALMRQNLRRAHPDADPQEIERRLCEWLSTRPGAEFGDCEGVVLRSLK